MASRIARSQREVYSVEEHLSKLLDSALSSDVRSYEIYGSSVFLSLERKFSNIESVQLYVDGLMKLSWVRELWPEKSQEYVTVGRRFKSDDAVYFRNSIRLNEGNRGFFRELVILHEMAHHFGGGGHGVRFRKAYVALIKGAMDEQFGWLMEIFLEQISNGELK